MPSPASLLLASLLALSGCSSMRIDPTASTAAGRFDPCPGESACAERDVASARISCEFSPAADAATFTIDSAAGWMLDGDLAWVVDLRQGETATIQSGDAMYRAGTVTAQCQITGSVALRTDEMTSMPEMDLTLTLACDGNTSTITLVGCQSAEI